MSSKLWRLILIIGASLFYLALVFGANLSPTDHQRFSLSPGTLLKDQREGMRLDISLRPTTLALDGVPQFKIETLWYKLTVMDSQSTTLPNRLCIDSVHFVSLEAEGALGLYPWSTSFPRCRPLSSASIRQRLEDRQEFIFDLGPIVGEVTRPHLLLDFHGSALYPYDRDRLTFGVIVQYRLLHNQEVLASHRIGPEIATYLPDTFGWQVQGSFIPRENTFLDDTWGYEAIDNFSSLTFERSLMERFIYPSLIFVVFLFIVLLAFVDSIDAFIEGGLAVFLSIFGLRELLLPPGAEVRTLVDYAIWGLYFAFGGAVVQSVIAQVVALVRGTRTLKSRVADGKSDPPHLSPSAPPSSVAPYNSNTQAANGSSVHWAWYLLSSIGILGLGLMQVLARRRDKRSRK